MMLFSEVFYYNRYISLLQRWGHLGNWDEVYDENRTSQIDFLSQYDVAELYELKEAVLFVRELSNALNRAWDEGHNYMSEDFLFILVSFCLSETCCDDIVPYFDMVALCLGVVSVYRAYSARSPEMLLAAPGKALFQLSTREDCILLKGYLTDHLDDAIRRVGSGEPHLDTTGTGIGILDSVVLPDEKCSYSSMFVIENLTDQDPVGRECGDVAGVNLWGPASEYYSLPWGSFFAEAYS